MLGVIAIAIGTAVVAFNANRFDVVVFRLPIREGHGVHLHDLIGVTFVAIGTLVLWLSPRSG